jgi:hypothetical protein
MNPPPLVSLDPGQKNGANPKAEIRIPKETRSPKSE